jgi:hypothetical protein
VNACGVEDIHDGTNYSRYPWDLIEQLPMLSEMGNIFSFSYLISLFSTILWIRTACVIAVAKARDTFEPFLHQVSWCLLLFTPLGGSTCNLLLQMVYTTNFGIIPNPFLLLLLSASYLFWGAA